MKIGYVRVSKQEQHEMLQIDALKEAGCEKWFLDKTTGSKAERKGLDEALAYLRRRYASGVEAGSGRTLVDPFD
jgi:DNA invertase Pin-like site-specific DNA recombinase